MQMAEEVEVPACRCCEPAAPPAAWSRSARAASGEMSARSRRAQAGRLWGGVARLQPLLLLVALGARVEQLQLLLEPLRHPRRRRRGHLAPRRAKAGSWAPAIVRLGAELYVQASRGAPARRRRRRCRRVAGRACRPAGSRRCRCRSTPKSPARCDTRRTACTPVRGGRRLRREASVEIQRRSEAVGRGRACSVQARLQRDGGSRTSLPLASLAGGRRVAPPQSSRPSP